MDKQGFSIKHVHYRREPVKCGKPGCGKCPHGPYWYAYFRRGVRLTKRYVGIHLPQAVIERGPAWIAEFKRPSSKKGTDSCAT
jgi:hypothetical protein